MKHILHNITPLVLLFLLTAGQISAQSRFEGTLTLSALNEATGEKASVTWITAGGNHKLSFETRMKEGDFRYALLYRTGESDVMLLTEGEEKNLKYRVPVSGFPKSALVQPGSRVIPEEGEKLVAGVNCHKYTIFSGGNTAVLWVGELPGFGAGDIPPFMQNNGILACLKAQGISGIPMEFSIYDDGQKLVSSQTVIGIQAHAVSPAEFAEPAGYTPGN